MKTSGLEFDCQDVSWNECGKEKCAKTVIHLKIPRIGVRQCVSLFSSLFLSSVIQIKMGNHDVQPNGLNARNIFRRCQLSCLRKTALTESLEIQY